MVTRDDCSENREKLEEAPVCGCFHCLSTFESAEIGEWVGGDTALCPRCGIDSVVPTGDAGRLREMRGEWFGELFVAE